MLFGMGTVFIFLTILVFATTIMSKLVNRFAAEPESPPLPNKNRPVASNATTVNPTIVKAIEKAIAEHRRR